jgi:hypothetical protein
MAKGCAGIDKTSIYGILETASAKCIPILLKEGKYEMV